MDVQQQWRLAYVLHYRCIVLNGTCTEDNINRRAVLGDVNTTKQKHEVHKHKHIMVLLLKTPQ